MAPQTGYRYQQLYRVTDGHVPDADHIRYRDFTVVVGAVEDPAVVEAALGLWVFGRKLIGVDWGDVLAAAGGGAGLARVVSRNRDLEHDLASMLADLMVCGFGDGFVLMQTLSIQDRDQPTIQDLVDLIDRVFAGVGGPIHYTMVPDWIYDATVLIGFRWRQSTSAGSL